LLRPHGRTGFDGCADSGCFAVHPPRDEPSVQP
jgi:hypothetical protein